MPAMTRDPCAIRVICWLAAAHDGIDAHPASEKPDDCEAEAGNQRVSNVVKLAANGP